MDFLTQKKARFIRFYSGWRKKKLIKGTFKESPLGPKRKYYALTQEGKDYVDQFYQAWQEVKESVDRIF